MIDYDTARHIEVLNKFLGMEHRLDGYDLSDTADLKGALEYAVAAYRDYDHYKSMLGGLIESFDESVEYFDTASWVNMTRAPDSSDSLIMDCVSSLMDAHSSFAELADRAEKHLAVMMKVAVTAPTAIQLEILGKSFDISPSEIDGWLDGLFMAMSYADYHRSIPENFNEFLTVLEAGWEEDAPLLESEIESDALPF